MKVEAKKVWSVEFGVEERRQALRPFINSTLQTPHSIKIAVKF
jgi:hypothetical protein